MPPSGYSQPVVSNMIDAIRGNVIDLRREVSENKHEDLRTGIRFEISQINRALAGVSEQTTGSFKLATTTGSLAFIQAAYQDILVELESGEHPNEDAAIEHALSRISDELIRLHIDQEGSLVERPT